MAQYLRFTLHHSHSASFPTEDNSAHRPEHQHQRDPPRDIRRLDVKLLVQLRHRQGNSEEIKGIPRPGEESDQEEQPLLQIEQRQEFERVGRFGHGRFERGDPSREVPAHGHVLVGHHVVLGVGRVIARGSAVVGGHGARFVCWVAGVERGAMTGFSWAGYLIFNAGEGKSEVIRGTDWWRHGSWHA